MTEFRFAHPIAFLLLIPAVTLLILRLRGRWQMAVPALMYSDIRLLSNLPTSWRIRLRRLPDILRLVAWLLLIVALARPQSGNARQVLRGEGIDIALTIDISGSMGLPDFAPNRLGAAKNVINDFINGREFDRIGLVVFASDSFYQAPLTLDYDVLKTLLNEILLAPALGLEEQTAIGLGIASAANMLRSGDAASKVIILLTDGANNTGSIDPITAAEAAATFGIRIYTIGVGQPGQIEFVDSNGQTRTIESDLDQDTLRTIADITGGAYFLATDLADLQRIYDQIDRLERSQVERQVIIRWQDQVLIWIVAGFALLIIERLLRYTVFQTIP